MIDVIDYIDSTSYEQVSLRDCTLTLYELSPKFNCCKMEYLFILRLKGPLRFSMFRTCLSRKLAWPCVFSTAYVTLVVALLFGSLVLLLAFLSGFFSRFLSLRRSTVTLRGGSACMFLRMDGQRFWFCHLRVIAFSSRAKHMLQNSRSAASSLVRMHRS